MMDLQAFVDALNEQDCATRSGYHLTLGGLRDALADAPENALVIFRDGTGAGGFGSYRGYYIDIAIDDGEPRPVAEWRKLTADALVKTFTGYKGGDYPASPDKPLWRSEYGEASGVAIIDAQVIEGAFVLLTKQVD